MTRTITGKQKVSIRGIEGEPSSLAFSPDGVTAAVVLNSFEHTARISVFQLTPLLLLGTFEKEILVDELCLAGSRLFVLCEKYGQLLKARPVQVYDIGSSIGEGLNLGFALDRSMAVSPDGVYVGGFLSNKGLRIFEVASGRKVFASHEAYNLITWSPDGRWFATGIAGSTKFAAIFAAPR